MHNMQVVLDDVKIQIYQAGLRLFWGDCMAVLDKAGYDKLLQALDNNDGDSKAACDLYMHTPAKIAGDYWLYTYINGDGNYYLGFAGGVDLDFDCNLGGNPAASKSLADLLRAMATARQLFKQVNGDDNAEQCTPWG